MDDDQLRQELEKLHGTAFGWAMVCCSGNRAEAEDVLQTTYVKILDGRARFAGRSSFKTWFFSVIRRTAADTWRRHLLRLTRLGQYRVAAARESSRESLEQTHYRVEIDGLLRVELENLPLRQRQVIGLVFQYDLTLSEAAEVLGVSVDSVRTHYHRGKQRIRRRLIKAEVDDGSGTG